MGLAEEPEYCPPTVSNYVCTANLNVRLNNAKLAYILGGRCTTKIFPCCTITGLNPHVTFQAFEQNQNKIVVSGASSKEEALLGLRLLTLRLSVIFKRHIRIHNFHMENIVAFGGFGFYFDQCEFFKNYQMSASPPASMATAGMKRTVANMPVSNRKRKRMRGSCFCEFKPARFKGLQFFIKYPIVVILYPTGKYVVTGSDDKDDILLAINAVAWSQYKLAPGDTIEAMNKRVKKMFALKKWLPYGYHSFDDPTKRFCNVFSRAYLMATTTRRKVHGLE